MSRVFLCPFVSVALLLSRLFSFFFSFLFLPAFFLPSCRFLRLSWLLAGGGFSERLGEARPVPANQIHKEATSNPANACPCSSAQANDGPYIAL